MDEILEVEQMASCKILRDLSTEDIVSKAKDLMKNDSVTAA